MQTRTEGSVLSSLSELRSIERQRIDDERSARERAATAKVEAERAAEQALRDAEQARVRAERDEQIRVAEARATAEREARLRVEAAEAAERARFAAVLDQQRLAEEMALRRAEVANKRPRWMIAVTAIGLVTTIALAALAIDRAREADVATEAKTRADRERLAAIDQMRESRAKVEAAQRELDDMQVKLDKAIDDVKKAQDAKALQIAQAHLAEVARAHADAQRWLDEQKAEQAKRDRDKVIDLKKCSNAGALGCMDRR